MKNLLKVATWVFSGIGVAGCMLLVCGIGEFCTELATAGFSMAVGGFAVAMLTWAKIDDKKNFKKE